MQHQIAGIHHVTAIAGDPQRNLDFYTGVLGLRLVKLTVNFDDPATYHLYYGDRSGAPGTILTFFPWAGAPVGRRGAGQLTVTSLSVPPGSMSFWVERFRERNVVFTGPERHFGEDLLEFHDPDGMQLALVANQDPRDRHWTGGGVPDSCAIRGVHGIRLSEEGLEHTDAVLTKTLGFRRIHTDGTRVRYAAAGSAAPGGIVDIDCVPDLPPGRVGVGSVHHVAWRTPDDAGQRHWRAAMAAAGLNVTPVMDRKYFRSIYFREPGGVLFEIATDIPGFAVDEPAESLGSRISLPEWLEPRRSYIEARLVPLRLPSTEVVAIRTAGSRSGDGESA